MSTLPRPTERDPQRGSLAPLSVGWGTRPRCEIHAFLLDQAGVCLRCAKDAERRQLRGLGKTYLVVAAVVVTLLALFSFGRSVVVARSEAREQARVAAAAKGSRLVVYTTTSCPACKMAKSWMRDHDVAYLERSVDTDPAARAELTKITGGSVAVPTFMVDDEVLTGFDPKGILLSRAMQKHGLR